MPTTYTFKKDEVDFVPKGGAFLKRDLSLRERKKKVRIGIFYAL